jgi:uncharacterized protein
MIVISDTSPITNLAAIGQLDLLRQIYGTIVIPLAVYREMAAAGKTVPGSIEVQTLPWIQTQTLGNVQRAIDLQVSHDQIDVGEAEAIVLALELKADVLLMDERRGRALANTYALNVIGLLGVLLQAKRNGMIPAVKPLMDQLIEQADFRVSPALYNLVLQSASE